MSCSSAIIFLKTIKTAMIKSPVQLHQNTSPEHTPSMDQRRSLHITQFQIFLIFFKLGCISFGGPAAHLVFFHQRFVQQLKWLTGEQYTQLVALSQIIPGPSSSQVGIAIGYLTKGYLGSLSAWLGFTLPSFILMTCVAYFGQYFFSHLNVEIFHILKLIVLAVVIFAFWQMLKSACNTVWQYLLMLLSALFIYTSDLSLSQIILIFVAALCGLIFSKTTIKKNSKHNNTKSLTKNGTKAPPTRASSNHFKCPQALKASYLWLVAFIAPFAIFAVLKTQFNHPALLSIEGFYASASMVFGNGHIVLPLLHQDFVDSGFISNEKFDLGYAVVQLMPGPLFSFASYLGALLPITNSMLFNAVIATCAIFLPSFFLIFGTLPYWSWLMKQEKIYRAVEGINAAVIGLLLCLIVQMTESYIKSWIDIGFVIWIVLLLRTKIPVVVTIISSFSAYYFLLMSIHSF